MNLGDVPIPEGMGVASFVLMNGLISRLLAKGILSTEDAKLIIDEAMLGLEERGGLSVPELKGAHALLSALWGIVQASSDSHPKSGE